MSKKIAALIVAGGYGNRFESSLPKQYTNSILQNTISKFISSNLISAIQVVIRPEDLELYKKSTTNLNLLPVTFGGETRGQSVKKGLLALKSYNPEIVLVHDACRPYVSKNMIEEIINQLLSNPKKGIAPALQINDTVKKLEKDRAITIDRNALITVQTPQGFYFKQLLDIYESTEVFSTDESSLMENNHVQIVYIPGEKNNKKITYKEDLAIKIRTGIGFDTHKFSSTIAENNYVTLGGIKIPFDKKLEAHSDGDVLIHALVDAILGSISEGDIGIHFPPSDQKWKNADSKLFLLHADNLLKQKNGKINNIDITVICEKPRLGEYREIIKNNLAKILNITTDQVNLKATTTEKMGFTGRGEGIAVQAIATIEIY